MQRRSDSALCSFDSAPAVRGWPGGDRRSPRLRRGIAPCAALATVLIAGSAQARGPQALAVVPQPPARSPHPGRSLRDGDEAHRYSRYRSSWYVGVGVGVGAGQMADRRGYALSPSAGVETSVRVGWIALPWLLLGAELSIWSAPQARWRQIYHGGAALTIFPLEDLGLYGKAGLGAGVALLREEQTDAGVRADLGFDLRGALGYEFQVGSSLNVGVEVRYCRTSYVGGAAHDLAGSLTFVWY